VGRKLEEEVARQATERKASHGAAPGRPVNTGGDSPQVKGQTRDIVGKAVGMGGSLPLSTGITVITAGQGFAERLESTKRRIQTLYKLLAFLVGKSRDVNAIRQSFHSSETVRHTQ